MSHCLQKMPLAQEGVSKEQKTYPVSPYTRGGMLLAGISVSNLDKHLRHFPPPYHINSQGTLLKEKCSGILQYLLHQQ